MNRTPLLAAAGLLTCGLLGPVGLAAADDTPAPRTAAPAATAAATGTATGTAAATRTTGPAASQGSTASAAPSTTSTSTPTTTTTTSSPTPTTTTTTTPSPTTTTTPTPTPVVPTVSITTSHTFVALRHYRFHGTLRPTGPRPATVTLQRVSGHTWKTLEVDRVDSKARWSAAFHTGSPTLQRFRAVARWHNGARAVTRTVKRRVLARADARVSGPLHRSSVPWSYRAGCPVGPKSLRRITINRFTYHYTVARGSLVVRAGAVDDLLRVFKRSFAARFPVRSMKPTDAFYDHGHRTPTGSDIAAMKADNTSAFNCRPVTGNPYRVSQHSYGNAIDINTVRNPYVVGSRVYPSFAKTYLDRKKVRTGMIVPGSTIAKTMSANGWPWGARWAHPDYQHFSSNGG